MMVASFWSRRGLCAAVLGLCAAACSSEVPTGPREGRRSPRFSIATLDGGSASLTLEDARPSLVVFWASWCGPCRREATEVAEIVQSYGDRLQVVSINSG